MKRIVWLLLLCLLLSVFGGCTKPDQAGSIQLPGQDTPAAPASLPDANETAAGADAFHLDFSRTALPGALAAATAGAVVGETMLLGGLEADGAALYACPPGEDALPVPLPSGTEYLYALCADAADGFWLLCGSYPASYIDANDVFQLVDEPAGKLALAHYDAAFALQETLLLQAVYTERFMQLAAAEDGFYLLSRSTLARVDKTGAETARVFRDHPEEGEFFTSMQPLGGSLYVLADTMLVGSVPELWRYDGALASEPEVLLNTAQASGIGPYDGTRLLFNGQNGIYAAVPGSEDGELLFSWKELGIESSAEQLWQVSDGFVFFTPGETAVESLRRQPGPAPVRTELTLAVITTDPLLYEYGQMLRDFNLSQTEWVIDYTVYTSTDYGDGEPLDLLRTQLIAGQLPDLYLFCTRGYADPGLHPEDVCADLLPLLGEDFTADSLLPGLYGLLTADGALYQLPLEVYVDTMIGPARLFPSAGMTLEELDEARVEAGDGWVPIESWNTPQNLFGLCTGFCIGAYTNRAAGTCNFQTQGFYDFLTWCKTWGGDGSIAEQPEKALLRIAAATPAALANRSENTETWFGEPGYTYVGFPSPNGSCSAYDLRSALGVSPQCRDTDGAKALLEYCFSYPIGDMPSPASRRLYDALMEEYMAGERKNFFGDVQRISREDAQKAYDLMASITVLEGFDGALDDILSEEAAVFFSGGCTAEEAAAKIQSRASIYLMEHKG